MTTPLSKPLDPFVDRHLGLARAEVAEMLESLGFDSLSGLTDAVVPESIRATAALELGEGGEEHDCLEELRKLASKNSIYRSFIGLGYHHTRMPEVIRRNLLENPGWYTQYTPYQAEIAQGRLEILVTFQTLVADLTALPLANSSLLDEATAAAEAMAMCHAIARGKRRHFVVAPDCHPQTIAVVQTRARPLGIEIHVADPNAADLLGLEPLGVLVQYPATDGRVRDLSALAERTHEAGSLLVAATDLLALTLLRPPGEMGVDVAVGSSQRLGVPLGFGGPHAAFFAARGEHERFLPGRITGISKDAAGNEANRLARQTREQHIRRERATSNICTAQVLPAILAAMYAVYHGPEGLKARAARARHAALLLAAGLRSLGIDVGDEPHFDTLRAELADGAAAKVLAGAREHGINLRDYGDGSIGVALDETVTEDELATLLGVFAEAAEGAEAPPLDPLEAGIDDALPDELRRTTGYLEHEVFHRYRSEHEFLRYVFALQARDLSLVHSMIPLGSCTMKLNAAAEMVPVTWPEFGELHPFAPVDQAAGYFELFADLRRWLAEITALPAVSLQPNAGSQGELSSLLAIRGYHEAAGDTQRDVCLIPTSAHGTNPASAVMAGLRVVPVQCDSAGNIDLDDLASRTEEHADHLAAIMVTYPSTHGVFEREIRKICDLVHDAGGKVFLDGANMNAQVGLCRPGDYGADICHLNLHKTFCIPHGGGGPGMGPICGTAELEPFLPGHPLGPHDRERRLGPVSAAPYGSPGILPISWMYIRMMGAQGLLRASQLAILAANYMAKRLADHYPVLYTGETGFVAHEFILDLREFRKSADVTVDDVAKRLMDYGFHAPTMSWPVAGTMMVEPTESESKLELDRFCEAMIAIREEIREIENGAADRDDNLLRNAPHTALEVAGDGWSHPYSRERAAFPTASTRERKFWPPVARIDNAFGDRNLVCTCEPVSSYA